MAQGLGGVVAKQRSQRNSWTPRKMGARTGGETRVGRSAGVSGFPSNVSSGQRKPGLEYFLHLAHVENSQLGSGRGRNKINQTCLEAQSTHKGYQTWSFHTKRGPGGGQKSVQINDGGGGGAKTY